jgi:hypothetical protein
MVGPNIDLDVGEVAGSEAFAAADGDAAGALMDEASAELAFAVTTAAGFRRRTQVMVISRIAASDTITATRILLRGALDEAITFVCRLMSRCLLIVLLIGFPSLRTLVIHATRRRITRT